MIVRFGNLSVLQFEDKTEVDLKPEDREWLEAHRIDSANANDPNGFHIFDKPLSIVAGENIGAELVKRLTGYPFKRHFTVETTQSED